MNSANNVAYSLGKSLKPLLVYALYLYHALSALHSAKIILGPAAERCSQVELLILSRLTLIVQVFTLFSKLIKNLKAIFTHIQRQHSTLSLTAVDL